MWKTRRGKTRTHFGGTGKKRGAEPGERADIDAKYERYAAEEEKFKRLLEEVKDSSR